MFEDKGYYPDESQEENSNLNWSSSGEDLSEEDGAEDLSYKGNTGEATGQEQKPAEDASFSNTPNLNYNQGYYSFGSQSNTGYYSSSYNQQYKPPYSQNGFGGYQNQQRNNGFYPPQNNEYNHNAGYRWDFQQYDNLAEKSKGKKSKKKGVAIFCSIIGGLLVLTLIATGAAFAVRQLAPNFDWGAITSGSTSSRSSSASEEEGAEFIINSKPETSASTGKNPDGTLSPENVVKKVRPSIVGVVQYQTSSRGQPAESGQGSGIILTSDGYILTNAHVVEGADLIKVVLDNGDEHEAVLRGADSKSDLAVLKINVKNLTAAELGNSDQLLVGESVIAIGNPGGLVLAGSATGGMISGLNRPAQGDTGYAVKYIQTDAAINPGNSGGALVNMYGQVIGINSAKIVATGYEGIGFSIAMNEALPIISDLQKYGYVKDRPRIGITFNMIDEVMASYYDIPTGLLIVDVDKECDVYKKGLKRDDIITKIDGKIVTSTDIVAAILKDKKPGDKIRLTVYRESRTGNSTFEVSVILSEDKGTLQ